MRKRNIRVTFRLNEQEFSHMKDLVELAKIPQEEYIRLILNGITPMPALPLDYHKMTSELNAIGNNLNQLARKANSLNAVNAIEFKEFAYTFDRIILGIMKECMIKKWARMDEQIKIKTCDNNVDETSIKNASNILVRSNIEQFL